MVINTIAYPFIYTNRLIRISIHILITILHCRIIIISRNRHRYLSRTTAIVVRELAATIAAKKIPAVVQADDVHRFTVHGLAACRALAGRRLSIMKFL